MANGFENGNTDTATMRKCMIVKPKVICRISGLCVSANEYW